MNFFNDTFLEKGSEINKYCKMGRNDEYNIFSFFMASYLPLDTPKSWGLLNSHLGNESYISGYLNYFFLICNLSELVFIIF